MLIDGISKYLSLYAVALAMCVLFVSATKPILAQDQKTFEVPSGIVRQLVKDEDLKEYLVLKRDGAVENLVAYSLELNRDEKPEIVVHGIGSICGAANCVHWIFRKAGNDYQLLLKADGIQNVEPQETFTNGYRNIITSMHGSAWTSDLTLYKFDGGRYRQAGCFFRTYRYKSSRGRMREWKRPQVTTVKCDPV